MQITTKVLNKYMYSIIKTYIIYIILLFLFQNHRLHILRQNNVVNARGGSIP